MKSQTKRLVHSCDITIASSEPDKITEFIRKIREETQDQSSVWVTGIHVTSKMTEVSEIVNLSAISKEM